MKASIRIRDPKQNGTRKFVKIGSAVAPDPLCWWDICWHSASCTLHYTIYTWYTMHFA